ncbi:MAG: signal peptidase I [Erysipelotrichaceae bacterium]|nr:signal peptidase I [Erysipelotrichaceae bacterium]
MKEKSVRRGISLLFRGAGLFLILAALVMMLPFVLPRFFGYETYRIVSPSMAPAVPQGSLVLVREAEGEEIAEGEIIAFYRNGTVVVHRALENDPSQETIITKGDANAEADLEELAYPELIGRVIYHAPYLGDLGEILSSFGGRIYLFTLIGCAALCFLLAERV